VESCDELNCFEEITRVRYLQRWNQLHEHHQGRSYDQRSHRFVLGTG
jgi:hypothetical protein